MADKIPVEELVRFQLDKSGIGEVIKGIQDIGAAQKNATEGAIGSQEDYMSSVEKTIELYEDLEKAMKDGTTPLNVATAAAGKLQTNAGRAQQNFSKGNQAAQLMGKMVDQTSKKSGLAARVLGGGIKETSINFKAMGGAVKSSLSPLMKFGWIGLVVYALEKIISRTLIISANAKLLQANLGNFTAEAKAGHAVTEKLVTQFGMGAKEAGDFVINLAKAGAEQEEIAKFADDAMSRQQIFGVAAEKQVQTMQHFQDNMRLSEDASNNLLSNVLMIGAGLDEWTPEEFLDQVVEISKITRDLNMSLESSTAFLIAMADTNVLKASGMDELANISKQGRIELVKASTALYKLPPGLQAFVGQFMPGMEGKTPMERIVQMRRGGYESAEGFQGLFGAAQAMVQRSGVEGAGREFILGKALKMLMPGVSEQTVYAMAEAWLPEMDKSKKITEEEFKELQKRTREITDKLKPPQEQLVDLGESTYKALQGVMGYIKEFVGKILFNVDKVLMSVSDFLQTGPYESLMSRVFGKDKKTSLKNASQRPAEVLATMPGGAGITDVMMAQEGATITEANRIVSQFFGTRKLAIPEYAKRYKARMASRVEFMAGPRGGVDPSQYAEAFNQFATPQDLNDFAEFYIGTWNQFASTGKFAGMSASFIAKELVKQKKVDPGEDIEILRMAQTGAGAPYIVMNIDGQTFHAIFDPASGITEFKKGVYKKS